MSKLIAAFAAAGILALAFPGFWHGFANWYLTGFDDLVIFAATYTVAVRRKNGAFAVLGLATAVLAMLAVVTLVGKSVPEGLLAYAPLWTLVPLYFAAESAYRRDGPDEDTEREHTPSELSRGQRGMFLRGFSGFAMNCSDDIALNTAAAFSGYSASGLPAYLLGVFAGAALMVAIVVFSRGKAKIGAGWKTQCAFYLLASAAILWNSLPPGFQFPVFRI